MKPPEEVKHEFIRQWLKKADEDLNAARVLLSHEAPFLFAVGFHSQQAAEKYIKAFLTSHQIEFPKTHDLDELLDLIEPIHRNLAKSLRDIIVLTKYGVDIRYPGDVPDMKLRDAQNAVKLAEKAQKAILKVIGIT